MWYAMVKCEIGIEICDFCVTQMHAPLANALIVVAFVATFVSLSAGFKGNGRVVVNPKYDIHVSIEKAG